MADREETLLLDVNVDVEDSVESIDALTKANKELRKERNALNLQSEQGKKRAQEINTLIDSNTAKIKENVSAIEKQKINIGNYKSALDGVHPALGKVGQGLESGTAGFKAMTTQALRFIATPIGAILAALVAVFTLLKTAISTNNAILDKFENITNAVGVVLNVIINRVGKLGEALIALASGDFDKAINLTSEAFTGLAAEIGAAVAQGQLYLDLSRDLEDAQRALRIETAKQENEIRRLVVASKNRSLSLEEQEGLLRKALALEEQLVAKRAENAQKDLVITAKQIALDASISQSADETFDQFVNRLVTGTKLRDEQIDSIIDKIEALEQARGSSLAFQEKLENNLSAIQEKRALAIEKQTKALEEQAAQQRAIDRAANQIDSPTDDPLVGAFQTRATLIEDINDRMLKDLAARNKDFRDEEAERVKKDAEIQVQVERSKLQILANLSGSLATLAREDSEARKVFATAQATINTYLAATAAYASGSEINVFFGVAAAAAAVAAGLANVARINEVEFAEGGVVLRGPSHAQGGIPIEAEGGEIIMTKGVYHNPSLRAMASAINVAGGGRKFADGGVAVSALSAPINAQLELANIIKNMPVGEVDVTKISKAQREIAVKQKISRR